MSVLAVSTHYHVLPGTPYDLWLRDELADELKLPHDGTRVEIIGGEIVVSPAPGFTHNSIIWEIQKALAAAQLADPSFQWECVHSQDLDLSDIHDGYIPDLCVLDRATYAQANAEKLRKLRPHHLAVAVEVTSPSNAQRDRRSGPRASRATKWHGYARVGVPFYLLVDRDPKIALITLFSEPDRGAGEYRASAEWKFGDDVDLPAPLGFSFATADWDTWD